ncbi:MAG: hypothetical protein QOI21_2842 [Actinomycetota bacterium]|jgi:hypothetical protein|nr:hypothetical protein [Actinomycetota bacterium]
MSTLVVVIIVIAAVAAVVLIALLVRRESQRRHLREKFGPEYERAVQDKESPRAADRELASREKRIAQLDIKPLSPEIRERYTQQWSLIQAKFVDRPAPAVEEADRVLVELMAERGYPTEGYEQQLSDLSVRHSRTLKHYRAAHETMQGHEETQKSTEELRDAMVRYRTVFDDLLTEGSGDGHGTTTRSEDRQDRKARTDASNGTS